MKKSIARWKVAGASRTQKKHPYKLLQSKMHYERSVLAAVIINFNLQVPLAAVYHEKICASRKALMNLSVCRGRLQIWYQMRFALSSIHTEL